MKKRYIWLSLILILSLLLNVACTSAPVSQNPTSGGSEDLSMTASGSETDYYSYLTRYRDVPAAAERLSAELVEMSSEVTAISVAEEMGWLFSADSTVTFRVQVPETAYYHLDISYCYTLEDTRNLPYSLLIDGAIPFDEAENLQLKRIWSDEGAMTQDKQGNDLIPQQQCLQQWQTVQAADYAGYTVKPFRLVLEAGEHTITIRGGQGLILGQLALDTQKDLPSYDALQAEYVQQGYQKVTGADVYLTTQGENTFQKSDQTIYPISDRSNVATYPNDPVVVRRNVIGGSAWAESGMWISYRVQAEQAGLYCLTVKYRQNESIGMAVSRNIYINGEIPCAEFENMVFPYAAKWTQFTLGQGGEPYYVYLHEGENIITFEATAGALSDILLDVSDLAAEMNSLYRRIIMVTSTNPDTYHDYYLDREIPDITQRFATLSARLAAASQQLASANGVNSDKSAILLRVAERMATFAEDVNEIPDGLTSFRDDITVVSNWLMECRQQPLQIDYFTFHAKEYSLPSANGTFWQRVGFAIRRFFATFSSDYQSMQDYENGDNTITVWVNSGLDQAQIVRDMSLKFTEEYGINVNVNVVQGGLVEASLAGNAPDVVIDCARGQPVNLASRNALADLSQFPGYEEVTGRFAQDAMVPYTYNDGVYALPLTQTYLMMFYRTDIFEEMNLKVPQTWDELLEVSAVLQRNNMTVGLPYTAISASGAVNLGVGAKDLYPTLLLQYGGDYYNQELTETMLDSSAALNAFKTWTQFYTQYSFPLSYDFNSRFRTGEMPLAVASLSMYGILSAAAPEIRGQWEMALMPGTPQEDGSIDRSGGASGTAIVMMDSAKNKDACWQYMCWFTETQTQVDYGTRLENLLGASARLASANLEAFHRLNWSDAELAVLDAQRRFVREIPELPGGYYTSRCIDNAFRAVVYQYKNERVELEKANDTINRELERKREELS